MLPWLTRIEVHFRICRGPCQWSMRVHAAIFCRRSQSWTTSTSSPVKSAYDDLKTGILAQATMSLSDKYTTIQHLDLGDTKPTDLLMPIDKYAHGWFDEELLKEVFFTKLPSDMRRLQRMQPPSTPATELARMAPDEDAIEELRREIEQLNCQWATLDQRRTRFRTPSPWHSRYQKRDGNGLCWFRRLLTTKPVAMLVESNPFRSDRGHLRR